MQTYIRPLGQYRATISTMELQWTLISSGASIKAFCLCCSLLALFVSLDLSCCFCCCYVWYVKGWRRFYLLTSSHAAVLSDWSVLSLERTTVLTVRHKKTKKDKWLIIILKWRQTEEKTYYWGKSKTFNPGSVIKSNDGGVTRKFLDLSLYIKVWSKNRQKRCK